MIYHFVEKHSFRIEGTTPQYRNQLCVIENAESGGTNIVTYVKSVSRFPMSVKYQNKIGSHFEVNCLNQH